MQYLARRLSQLIYHNIAAVVIMHCWLSSSGGKVLPSQFSEAISMVHLRDQCRTGQ